MDKQQSLQLFAQGKDAWNKWANKKLAEKERLKDAGAWEAEKDRWEKEAGANFSGHPFREKADFGEFVFPGPTKFVGAVFCSSALFQGVEFRKSAGFEGAKFLANTKFGSVNFFGNTWFFGAVFSDEVSFNGSTFHKNAEFKQSDFLKKAVFYGATFTNNTLFTESEFHEYATFSEATFSSNTWFKETKFRKGSNFKAINSEKYFNLDGAKFEQVPDFAQAHFLEAPSFDKIVIDPEARENPTPPSPHGEPVEPREGGGKQASILRQAQDEEGRQAQDEGGRKAQDDEEQTQRLAREAAAKEAREIPSRWRHLRRLATQGHDHENEQYFFAEEIKSRRNVFDHPRGKNWQRYWAGWIYQAFSDFGRSIARPFFWWLIGIIAYSATLLGFHLNAATGSKPLGISGCLLGDATPWTTAIKTAFDNALLLPVFGVSDAQVQEQLCLFGHDIGLKMPNLPPVPLVPFWVSFAGALHTVFSAVMIFLILLAMRNQFRIR